MDDLRVGYVLSTRKVKDGVAREKLMVELMEEKIEYAPLEPIVETKISVKTEDRAPR